MVNGAHALSLAAPWLTRAAEAVGLTPNVLLVFGGIFAGLVLGTIARLSHLHRLPPDKAQSLRLRLRTWWIISIVLVLVVLLGRPAIVLLVGAVSLLAVHEYLGLIGRERVHRHVVAWTYAVVVLQYAWIWLELNGLVLIFVPVLAFLLVTMRIVLEQEPEQFLPEVGAVHWGLMILVFCFSHVASLLSLPAEANPAGGQVGWFVYLVLLTEFNDIAQALWGRPFGKHKLIPPVSPGKSWEGLAGGVGCTLVLALLLAPVLTPLDTAPPRFPGLETSWPAWLSPWAAFAGLFIGVAGFFGDITISSLKRYRHVKDSGSLLPGQGGILDRIDSLTFTAPLFYHYVHFLYY